MAISERLATLLQASKVRFSVIKHPVVYTAQEIAAVEHVPGKQLAKCVLVLTDRGPALAVLPASYLIDFKLLKALLKAKTATIAKESDIKQRFPDVEVGAMSPFGNLYEVPVLIERTLGESEEIVFNAGSHTDTIRMRYADVLTLTKAKLGAFGRPISDPVRRPARKTRPATSSRKTARRAKPPTRRPTVRRPRAKTNTRKPR